MEIWLGPKGRAPSMMSLFSMQQPHPEEAENRLSRRMERARIAFFNSL